MPRHYAATVFIRVTTESQNVLKLRDGVKPDDEEFSLRQTVLIADTDIDARQELEAVLVDYDIDICVAEDADEALKLFIERGPALVFVDVFLPRRGGVDFLRRMRSVSGGKETAVIMLCGVKGLADLRHEAVDDLDARAFLSKPLREETVRNHVNRILQAEEDVPRKASPVSIFPPEPPQSRGDLSEYPFVSLFCNMAENRYTGTVRLAREKFQKAVHFVDGQVVFADSNRVAETLGRFMLESGAISQETYQKALDTLQSTGKKFGHILTEMGALDQNGIDIAVREHIVAKVVSLFGWTTGRYAIGDGPTPPTAIEPGLISSRRLVWEGIHNHLPFGEIFAVIRNSLEQYIVAKRDPVTLEEEFPVDEGDRFFLRTARRFPGSKVQHALSSSGGERQMRLLMALFALDVFEVCDSPDCNYVAEDAQGEEMRRIVEARKLLDRMKFQNHFLQLGIAIDSDDGTVKRAYQEKAKTYHPDAMSPSDPAELKQLHSEIFMLLKTAYEHLEKDGGRRAYLKSLQSGPEAATSEGNRILDAETSYQRGMIFIKKRKWAEALPLIEEAMRLNPDEAEYAVQAGVVKMNLRDGDRVRFFEEAKRHFLRAAELDYHSGEAYYRLAILYKLNGEIERASEYFHRALARSPNHVQSRLELRLLGSRGVRAVKPQPFRPTRK